MQVLYSIYTHTDRLGHFLKKSLVLKSYLGCVSLGKSKSRFFIQDYLDHDVSKEPTNPPP